MSNDTPRDWEELKKLAEAGSIFFESDEAGFVTCSPDVLELIAEVEGANREASHLAMALWRRHYRETAPDFELTDTAAGILTQIDNMTAGMGKRLDAATAELSQLKAERDRMAEDAEKWRALMSCERIRIMGRTLDYKHIGVEFWTKHSAAHPCPEFPQDECRAHLEEFVRRSALNTGETDD